MPATDYQGSPFASIGRSIFSIRRDQVHAMDNNSPDNNNSSSSSHELELESFQKSVTELFHDLSLSSPDSLLSLTWIRKLLDSFLILQEQFRELLLHNHPSTNNNKPPLLSKLASDFFDRSVKALDVLNAIRDGLDQIRSWSHHLDIVLLALNCSSRSIGEGQIRRAKKALTDLTILMVDEKDVGSVVAHRNRSFGRTKDKHTGSSGSHFRSLSWSVSRNWSAVRQLQAIGSGLNAPRANEIAATNGLATPIFTMNTILLFVTWALVAAIPCQDRGLQIHFSVPRNFPWAGAVVGLYDRIVEESKRRDRRNANGLLREIQRIEKCTRALVEVTEVSLPLGEEREREMREGTRELAEVCDGLREGLEPLERQVREVFHRIVRSRTEGLESLSNNWE